MKKNAVYYTIVNKNKLISELQLFSTKCSDSIKVETRLAYFVIEKMLNKFLITMPEIYFSECGKPYFKESDVFFNYSHSKNYIACSISFSEMGIDIEETSRKISNVIAKKYLDGAKDNEKRIEMWVRKESYSKLIGTGLKMKLYNINLDMIDSKYILIQNEEFICSIYCNNKNAKFIELDIDEIIF